jgi:hypothetical protein
MDKVGAAALSERPTAYRLYEPNDVLWGPVRSNYNICKRTLHFSWQLGLENSLDIRTRTEPFHQPLSLLLSPARHHPSPPKSMLKARLYEERHLDGVRLNRLNGFEDQRVHERVNCPSQGGILPKVLSEIGRHHRALNFQQPPKPILDLVTIEYGPGYLVSRCRSVAHVSEVAEHRRLPFRNPTCDCYFMHVNFPS